MPEIPPAPASHRDLLHCLLALRARILGPVSVLRVQTPRHQGEVNEMDLADKALAVLAGMMLGICGVLIFLAAYLLGLIVYLLATGNW